MDTQTRTADLDTRETAGTEPRGEMTEAILNMVRIWLLSERPARERRELLHAVMGLVVRRG